ncbi:MAG TPA: hypothetical protein DCZ01_07585 [Elusimicrobia bacterium]|nr:MAG: hypothetical protein A2X37_03310 [Elusimicrobia bacterium GWA2_66_18]OGR74381.1 MAG: hypothetical protein A2X40_10245 [Elusimicrobia bacterium GWC2_65_9]HAZ08366.1 hypothetical protein [Elusimicrobiota bacterium]
MLPRAALALAALLALNIPAGAAFSAVAYDAKTAPLDELSRDLLTTNGYELREDGKIWDKISDAPVPRAGMSGLLAHLAGARRLKALLQLNILLNRGEGEKTPTGEEREIVRTIVRQNWPVFGVGTRRDFRSYFSLEELESLDKIPLRFEKDSGLSTLKDPEPEPVPAAAPSAAVIPPAAVAAASVPLATPDLGTLKPWTPPAAPAAVKPSTSVAAPAAPAPPAPAPETPKPGAPMVSAEQYAQFVAEGPYTKEGKALLQMIGQKAPDFCLPLLRRTVVTAIPQVVFDGARTGAGLRAGLVTQPDQADGLLIVALSPGPVYVERRQSLFSAKQAVLLAESPRFYAELGVPAPALDALRRDAVAAGTQNGDWGAAKVFADGSRRGSYSAPEQAGELLEQLLLLGLSREDLTASVYAARRWARTARLLFSSRVKDDFGQDSFLDGDRRAELRGWLERPDEDEDLTLGSWAAARVAALDPRRGGPESELAFEQRAGGTCVRAALEDALAQAARARARRVGTIESLLDAGLLAAKDAKAAAQRASDEEADARRRLFAALPACPPADTRREQSLRKAALLVAEASRAERALRERKAKEENHERKD